MAAAIGTTTTPARSDDGDDSGRDAAQTGSRGQHVATPHLRQPERSLRTPGHEPKPSRMTGGRTRRPARDRAGSSARRSGQWPWHASETSHQTGRSSVSAECHRTVPRRTSIPTRPSIVSIDSRTRSRGTAKPDVADLAASAARRRRRAPANRRHPCRSHRARRRPDPGRRRPRTRSRDRRYSASSRPARTARSRRGRPASARPGRARARCEMRSNIRSRSQASMASSAVDKDEPVGSQVDDDASPSGGGAADSGTRRPPSRRKAPDP